MIKELNDLGLDIDLFLGLNKNSKILDFGSGNGVLSSLLINNNFNNVMSMDIDESSKIQIEKNIDRRNCNFIKIESVDFHELDSLSGYDLIICREVLEHIHNYSLLISKFSSILRPSGQVIISVPTKISEKIFSFFDKNWMTKCQHINIFSVKSIRKIFKIYGLKLKKKSGKGSKWFLFWSLLSPFKIEHTMGNPKTFGKKERIAFLLVNLLDKNELLKKTLDLISPKSYVYYFKKEISILILYDYEYWILGKWAEKIKDMYGHDFIIKTMSIFDISKNINILKKEEFDFIHMLLPHGIEYIKEINIPKIITIHHWTKWTDMYEIALNESQALMTGSNEWKEKLVEKRGNKEVIVVSSGIEEDLLSLPNMSNNEIINIGFFVKKDSNEDDRKGIRYLILIFDEILKQGLCSQYCFFITGPGWDDIVEEYTIKGLLIEYETLLEREDLVNRYKTLDYYLILSDVEGGPVTAAEAMASGTLLFSTSVGIVKETLKNGENGIIIENNNTNEIISKFEYYRINFKERYQIQKNGYDFARNNMLYKHTFSNIGDIYNSFFSNFCLGNKKNG